MSKILCILDGFGLAPKSANNAAALAKMPNFKYLLKNYFWTTLNADGERVGQEAGLVGNSEVGHMNIGGLKLVPQLSYQITKSSQNAFDLDKNIAPDQFFDPKEFLKKKFAGLDFILPNKIQFPSEGNNLEYWSFDDNNQKDKISIESLNNPANVVGYKIYLAYQISLETGCLDAGETLEKDLSLVSVEDFFGFLATWWTYSDVSLYPVQEMVKSYSKFIAENIAENMLADLKTVNQRIVFEFILEAYELAGVTIEIELISFLKDFRANLIDKSSLKTVHLVGLFSKGQIHSDLRHWAGSIEAAGQAGAEKIVMHLISDGRDSDRQSLVATWEYFIEEFGDKIKPFEDRIFLGSLGGRFYSMDRDNNWERVARGLLPMIDQTECWTWSEFNYRQHINLSQKLITLLKKYNLSLNQVFGKESNGFEVYRENDAEWSFFYGDHLDRDIWFNKWNLPKVDKQNIEIRDILQSATDFNYKSEVFDENIFPSVSSNSVNVGISKNDTVWLLNFRTDRMKEMSQMLCDINQEFDLNLDILGMNDYCIGEEIYLNDKMEVVRKKTETGYYPVFKNQPVIGTLAEYISNQNQTQLHIAETEKYNHVTYFMNGGQNKKWPSEDWMVIDSNKVASHAQMPEMKAKEVTDFILESGIGKYDYILVNYANPDMVGHTGDIAAATQTMEFVDLQLGRLIKACEDGGHEMIVTADHGNVEKVGSFDDHGKNLIDTEHNANFVPMIILSEKLKIKNKKLVIGDDLIQKAQDLINSDIANPDIEALKQTFSQINQVDLDTETWLDENQIPQPMLPLWYVGLLLICV